MSSAGPARVSKTSPQPEVLAAWPRSAQWATAFLLGTTVALLFVHFAGSWRWGARPSELQATTATARLDLNQAERIELLQLPGVGPNLAMRIETYRQTHGPFRSVDDLSNVSGIGPATLERLRPLVVVETEEGRKESALTMKYGAVEAAASVSAKDPTAGADSAYRPFFDKPPKILPTEPIDLNLATLEELQRLPRIGPKLAERIVQARAQKPFHAVGDLRRVSGIGPKTLEQIRPFVFIARAK